MCWTSPKLTDLNERDKSVTILHRFDYEDSEYWYTRFALDHDCKYLAVGTDSGKIYLWNLDKPDLMVTRFALSRKNSKSTVRQLSFSPDGRILVGVCDNGTIWRWDNTSV